MTVRSVSYSVLVLASLSTLGFMVYAAQSFRSLLSGFTLWALTPYLTFASAICIARTRGSIIAASIVSLVAVFFATCAYIEALFVHISSTSALVFLFIPFYQLLAAFVVLVFALERRYHRSQEPKHS